MQSVGKFDDDDTHIFSHGEDKLAETFRLMLGMIFKFEFFQFGEAVYHFGNGIAEFCRHFDFGHARIFQYIVHNARAEALNIHVPNRKLRGNGKGMSDVGFAAFTGLSVMGVESVGNGSFKLGLLVGIEIGCGAKQKLARFCCQRIIGAVGSGLAFSDGLYGYFKPSDCIGCDIAPIQSARRFYRFAGWFICCGSAARFRFVRLRFRAGRLRLVYCCGCRQPKAYCRFLIGVRDGRQRGWVEVVRDFTCAIFSSNTGHVCLLSFYVSNKRLFSLFFTNFPTGLR